MPPSLRVDEALDQVIAAAVARLDAARNPGGLLEDITAVVSGDRARARPDPPYLFVVVPGLHETQQQALHRSIVADLRVMAVVHSEAPEDGWLDAYRYALRAQHVLYRGDRSLGLDWVNDVRTDGAEAMGRTDKGTRFRYFARLAVPFTLHEPQED